MSAAAGPLETTSASPATSALASSLAVAGTPRPVTRVVSRPRPKPALARGINSAGEASVGATCRGRRGLGVGTAICSSAVRLAVRVAVASARPTLALVLEPLALATAVGLPKPTTCLAAVAASSRNGIA